MESYSFSHLSDETVLRQLAAIVHRERVTSSARPEYPPDNDPDEQDRGNEDEVTGGHG